MNTRDFKTKLYKEISSVTKSLGNPNRLEIMDLLAQGPASVEYISNHTNLPVANASQHLQVLKNANLVTVQRKGKYIFYALASTRVYEVWSALRMLGFSQNEEVNTLINEYRDNRTHLQVIGIDDLLDKLNTEDVLILDVRPEDEYSLKHLNNAVSIPHNEIRQRLSELPEDKEIVAYCRGPLCLMADEAVQFLNQNGYKAFRLDIGIPDLEASEIPFEIENNQNGDAT